MILTFVFPAIVAGMVWYWYRSVKKTVVEKDKEVKEKELLVGILEKLVRTKDSIIEKLKF